MPSSRSPTYLSQCTGKRVVYYPGAVERGRDRGDALGPAARWRASRPGPLGFAVNIAGAVPFAVKGTEKGSQGYNLIVIVKASSPYQKLADLKGKSVAHTAPSSNSGNLAPQALFPEQGLKPDKDYKILFSGGHDKSVLGVGTGDYDAAPVASDVFHRMVARGHDQGRRFRVIYRARSSRPPASPTRTTSSRSSPRS